MNILKEADKLTSGKRNKEYGHPKQFYRDVAKVWSVILDIEIPEEKIWVMMVLYKVIRTKQGYKKDNLIDIAGYARTGEMQKE